MEKRITAEMNLMEAIDKYPIVAEVLMRYGLGCSGCFISEMESVYDGIAVHGLDPDILIEEMNMIIEMQESGEYDY